MAQECLHPAGFVASRTVNAGLVRSSKVPYSLALIPPGNGINRGER